MEDLLNEDEFLQKKDNANPWKRFIVFYGIAIMFYVIATYIVAFFKETSYSIFFAMLFAGIMLATPFVMIFHKRKIILLPATTITIALFILITLFYFLNIIEVVHNYKIESIFAETYFLEMLLKGYGIVLLYGVICCAIILLIRREKLKKLSAKPQSSSL